MSVRAVAVVAALLVGGGAVAVTHGPAAAAPLAPTDVTGVATSADALQPAQRLRVVPPANFPMQVTPRCDILDNFGDPRSGGRTHEGTDMLATLGQEVYAMVDGTLTLQTLADSGGSSSLSGNLWGLTANDGTGTYFIYAHLSAFAAGLTKGAVVQRGQLIGYVGDTGNAGPGNYHLHFEVHPNGGPAVNPLTWVTVPAACKVY